MADAPNKERSALDRITGAFQRIQDKRAAAVNAEARPAEPKTGSVNTPPAPPPRPR